MQPAPLLFNAQSFQNDAENMSLKCYTRTYTCIFLIKTEICYNNKIQTFTTGRADGNLRTKNFFPNVEFGLI